MRIIDNLWDCLNSLVPEPLCATKNNDYDSIVWTDTRSQPTYDAVVACSVAIVVDKCCSTYCEKVNELKAEKFKANDFLWNNHLWQTTEDKQQIIASRALRAKSVIDSTGGEWSGGLLYYKDRDNNKVPFLTPQEFIEFAIAYEDYLVGIATAADSHKEALTFIRDNDGLTEDDRVAAMQEYDYKSGW